MIKQGVSYSQLAVESKGISMRLDKINALTCMGGKYWAINPFVPIIEYCQRKYKLNAYLEATGGGGKVLLHLNTCIFKKRIFNEIERGIANYFSCLCDTRDTKQVQRIITDLLQKFEPEQLFNLAKLYKDEYHTPRVLSAAYTFITAFGSFGGNRFRYTEGNFKKAFVVDQRHLELSKFTGVLRNAIITNCDCFDLLNRYNDRADFFTAIDPPYFNTNAYKNDWPREKHEALVQILLQTKMKVLLCGYLNSDIYEELERNGWERNLVKNISVKVSSKGKKADEYIWTNFKVPGGFIHKQHMQQKNVHKAEPVKAKQIHLDLIRNPKQIL